MVRAIVLVIVGLLALAAPTPTPAASGRVPDALRVSGMGVAGGEVRGRDLVHAIYRSLARLPAAKGLYAYPVDDAQYADLVFSRRGRVMLRVRVALSGCAFVLIDHKQPRWQDATLARLLREAGVARAR